MKKIFTLSALFIVAVVFFSGCVKNQLSDNNENYWLSQEKGEVIYSDSYCNYYVVETYNGFNIIRAYGNYKPFEGAIIYGNFSNNGTRDFYNYSTGAVFTGTITDYWLDYYEAQDALDYYCPFYGKTEGTSVKREFRKAVTKFNPSPTGK